VAARLDRGGKRRSDRSAGQRPDHEPARAEVGAIYS
jgi:hypothetical protein